MWKDIISGKGKDIVVILKKMAHKGDGTIRNYDPVEVGMVLLVSHCGSGL